MCHSLGPRDNWGVGSEKNRPLGPEKKRMVGSGRTQKRETLHDTFALPNN